MAVGKGWRPIVQGLVDLGAVYGISIHQVKEKFGGLRFYYAGPTDPAQYAIFQQMVEAAELKAERTCEDCGEDGYDYNDDTRKTVPRATNKAINGWFTTLCEPCRAHRSVSPI